MELGLLVLRLVVGLLFVGHGALELSAPEVHARHLIAVLSVTVGARRAEDTTAVLDVGGRLVLLRRRVGCRDQQSRGDTEECSTHSAFSAFSAHSA